MYKRYRYKIEMQYRWKDKVFTTVESNIKSLVCQYDYENSNMPYFILNTVLDKRMIDDMIDNMGKKTLVLTIKKYPIDQDNTIEEFYVHDEFSYFINENKNYLDDIDYDKTDTNREDLLRPISIGLISERLIDNNKRVINDVAMDTTLLDLILYHMRHMRLLIEPFQNKSINRLIIPPCNSITNLLKYVNSKYSIYNTGYRLFYDFKRTYLLSNTGKPVEALNDVINTIIMNVSVPTTPVARNQGIDINEETKKATFELGMEALTIYEDKATEKSYGSIIAIGPNGEYKKANINGNNSNRVKIASLGTTNVDIIDGVKSEIEANNIVLVATKSELDTSLFTLNKSYVVNNNDMIKDKSGTYKLTKKTEIYKPDGKEFILKLSLIFKKIGS